MKKVIKDFKETFNVYATYDIEQYKTKRKSFSVWQNVLQVTVFAIFGALMVLFSKYDAAMTTKVITLMVTSVFTSPVLSLSFLYGKALHKIDAVEKDETRQAKKINVFNVKKEAYYG